MDSILLLARIDSSNRYDFGRAEPSSQASQRAEPSCRAEQRENKELAQQPEIKPGQEQQKKRGFGFGL